MYLSFVFTTVIEIFELLSGKYFSGLLICNRERSEAHEMPDLEVFISKEHHRRGSGYHLLSLFHYSQRIMNGC